MLAFARNLFATLFFFSIILLGSITNRMPSREKVMDYVRENQTTLTQCVEAQDFSSLDAPVEDVRVRDDCIEFSCGGEGFGPETAYCGFFYSANDDLYAIWCAPSGTLMPTGSGFGWKEKDGDNTFYTEHIVGHFYYYEAAY